jgi:hypothetical protein
VRGVDIALLFLEDRRETEGEAVALEVVEVVDARALDGRNGEREAETDWDFGCEVVDSFNDCDEEAV